MKKLTDRNAVRVALFLAIDAEESLIDAYRNKYTGKVDENEAGVKIARRRIKAFRRVLDRYFDGARPSSPKLGKPVDIMALMKGSSK